MQVISDAFYAVLVFLINVYKSLEKSVIEIGEVFVSKHLEKLFKKAGVVFNGPQKHDPQIRKDKQKEFYTRVVSNGTLGLGRIHIYSNFN